MTKYSPRLLVRVLPILLPLCGCEPWGKPTEADKYVSPQQERSFDVLFGRTCSGCHGEKGKVGAGPPLNDSLFLSLMPANALKEIITNGRRGTLMPAFGSSQGGGLTEEQVEILTTGIKSRWGSKAPTTILKLTHSLGQEAALGNKEKGRQLFGLACASCHGTKGEGAEAGAINDPDFLALCSNQVLRRYIITGRPDLGMPNCMERAERPNDFKPLSEQDVDDLVALLASWRGGSPVAQKEND